MAIVVNGITVTDVILKQGTATKELDKIVVNGVTVFEKIKDLVLDLSCFLSLSQSFVPQGNFYAGGGGYDKIYTVNIQNPGLKTFYIRSCIWLNNNLYSGSPGSTRSVSGSLPSTTLATPTQSGGNLGAAEPHWYWGLQFSWDNLTWTSFKFGGETRYSSSEEQKAQIIIPYP